jgi:hypothetical protein
MTAQDSGRDLIGRPLEALPEPPAPALVIIPTGAIPMAKATYDGTYQDKDGNYFFIRKGDAIPDGAKDARR